MEAISMKRISVQLRTHLLPEERDKLDEVVREYNFKSRYQLVQTIVRAFLKAVAPEEGEFVCKDIEEMFEGLKGFKTASLEGYQTAHKILKQNAKSKLQPLSEYVNRYIEERYKQLSSKFRVLDNTLNEKGVSSLDKLNDTMLSLYGTDKTFKSYEEFYKWADNKFTPKKDRKRNIKPL